MTSLLVLLLPRFVMWLTCVMVLLVLLLLSVGGGSEVVALPLLTPSHKGVRFRA